MAAGQFVIAAEPSPKGPGAIEWLQQQVQFGTCPGRKKIAHWKSASEHEAEILGRESRTVEPFVAMHNLTAELLAECPSSSHTWTDR